MFYHHLCWTSPPLLHVFFFSWIYCLPFLGIKVNIKRRIQKGTVSSITFVVVLFYFISFHVVDALRCHPKKALKKKKKKKKLSDAL